ncbi:MAG: tetratricopeptide repeat protein [Oceanospirillaceae bacterium]|nr:tetratricopeptide repeat protein [Oceanospirillaceae bacterium]
MQNIDFSNKRALVIDNSSLVRSSTVANLSKLGFSHIKGSNGSSRALELVAADDYDLVLLGHSTTERNSGLQLLEKARHKNLIKPTACWGFMSGDNSPEVIIHASESEPDFVISKPFTLKQLQDRLQSAMARKQAVKPINQALDGGDIARALEFCDFVLDKNLSILSVKQKKADLLLHSQHFEEALALFEEVASLAPHNNIDLKICEAMIGCSRLEQAEERLDALIAKSPLLIKAYDLQASLYEKSGRLEESMQVLNRAMNISSMAISRNMKLGKLAIYTGKTDIAVSAFKRTIQLNTGSCHRTPEPYLGLANIQRESLKNDGDQEKIEKEIDVLLKEALTAFPDNAGLKVQIALFKSKLQDDLNNPEGAVQFRELAEKILFLNNLKDDIEQLNQSALTIVPEYEAILSKDSEEEEQSKGSQPEMSNKVNLQGIKQYLSKNKAKAIKYFTMSLELDRENGTALLNLAQVYLESMHDDEAERDKSQRMVKRYLGLVENLNKTEPQQTRFSQLKEYVSGGLENMPKGSLGMLLR